MHHTNFTPEGFAAFKNNDRPGPIQMLNLVRLKDQAAYEDGTIATGAEAYATYSAHTAPLLAKVGGHLVWRGQMEQMAIGPADEAWDHCFIVQYPFPAAFLEMVTSAAYQSIVHHRQAAVLDSRLIRLAPMAAE